MRENKVPAKIEGDKITFNFGTPDNFVLEIDRVMLGVMDGEPFTVTHWDQPEYEIQWMKGKELFYRMIAERIGEYVRRREGSKP
jgi:hypothetical protein